MNDLVSIVVPIYNVEPYLDECISSLVNQTYTNLEILLINDGSTDGSLKKCEEWASKDKRIQVFSKDNEGLGPTRNYGVKHANGEWIAFIDSDDWIENSYVEKMYETTFNKDVNLVRCNYRQVEVTGREGRITNDFISLGRRREERYIFATSSATVCPMLIKKKIFDKYYLEQPNCKTQDFAVNLAICLAAENCAYVEDVLLNYRKGRPGALTTGSESKRKDTAGKALPWLIGILKKNNFYENNMPIINQYVNFFMSMILFGGWMSMEYEDYIILKEIYRNSMSKEIDYRHKEIAVLGSWNITEAMRKISYLQDMEYNFHFSSLISVMSKENPYIEVNHKSKYREKMCSRDIKVDMWDVFDRKQPDYFVFDLLEERNNVLRIQDGFITESDAFRECSTNLVGAEIIASGSVEWFELWKKSCDAFVLKLQNYVPVDRIIMIRNYLTESYGTVYEQTEYEDIQKIRSANEVIRNCYDYIEEHYPEIKVVDMSKEQYYITDERYEYGVYPWYLNTMINEKIADVIKFFL